MKKTKNPAPKPLRASSPSNWQEYQHDGEQHVVENWPKLTKLFECLTGDNMPALHALAVSRLDADWERAWGMIRRLTGIRPVIIPEGIDASRLRPMPDQMVAELYKTDLDGIAVEISILQLAWHHLLNQDDLPEATPPAEKPLIVKAEDARGAASAGNFEFTNEQLLLLQLVQLPTTIFDYNEIDFDKRSEIEWFTGRVQEVRKVFDEPMAKALAQMALLNELQVRRINHKLVGMNPATKDFIALQDTKETLEATYGKQWGQIEEMCPSLIATSSRKTVLNHFSDLVKAYRTYKSNEDNRLRDGIFTDDEIQILFRQSVQDPDVKYRMGWVLACNEAKIGIADPKFKRKMSVAQCRMLDSGFAFAARRLSDKMSVVKPDLEQDGPDGEYPPLHMKRDGEVTEEEITPIEETTLVDAVEILEPGEIPQGAEQPVAPAE